MTGSSKLAIAGVFAAGLGFANIWPMLFSITVEDAVATARRGWVRRGDVLNARPVESFREAVRPVG